MFKAIPGIQQAAKKNKGDPQHPGCTRKIEYDGYGPMVVTGTDGNPGCLGRGPVTWSSN